MFVFNMTLLQYVLHFSDLRDYNDLERKYQQLWDRNEAIENQLIEKETKLNKLRSVSEKVYKEYDQLKNQYDVETQAMHKYVLKSTRIGFKLLIYWIKFDSFKI